MEQLVSVLMTRSEIPQQTDGRNDFNGRHIAIQVIRKTINLYKISQEV